MRQIPFSRSGTPAQSRAGQRGDARILVLVLAIFLTGVALGALWFSFNAKRAADRAQKSQNGSTPALSATTRTVLGRLEAPLEIHFYAVLDPAVKSDSMRVFVNQVERLLAAYGETAEGKIKVTRFDSEAEASVKAAAADGIKPFNLDKGDACYLGVALVHQGQKETLPRLLPEWESALESDLTRAIARLLDAKPATPASPVPSTDPAVIETVKRLVPNVADISEAEGTRLLREAALQEVKAAISDLEAQLKEAQQRLSQVQSSGTSEEQQAAMKHLQEIQAAQTEKLKQIAARSQAQVQALHRLKQTR